MKDSIKNHMNRLEENDPSHRERNDIATQDLFVKGRGHSPGKPFALEVGYNLDGGHHNRDRYHKNYDEVLDPNHRAEYDDVFQDLAERTAMLHDPAFILDSSDDENISPDREMARDLLEHLAESRGIEEIAPIMIQEVYHPMLKVLIDRLMESEELIDNLSHSMIHKTKHIPQDYAKRFKSHLLHPAVDNHPHRWKQEIEKHFSQKRGKNHA